jgi:hypothetical protein
MNVTPPPAGPPKTAPAWGEVLTSPVLLTGLYVWGIAVAPTALVASALGRNRPGLHAPLLALLASTAALPCLGLGAWLERRRHPGAPFLGIWGFLGLAATAWLATPSAVDVARLEALRGWLVSAGLSLYALAWGGPHATVRRATDEGRGGEAVAWAPRERLAPGAPALLGFGIVVSLALGALAWTVHEPPRALVAHALAGLVGVTFVSTVARVTVERGRSPERPGRSALLRRSGWAFAWVVLAAGGLFFFAALR